MTSDRWNRMMDGSYGMGYEALWFMFFIGLVLVALIGVAVYVALRAVDTRSPASGPTLGAAPPTPREVLDLRLARGEITPEEYSATRPLLDP